MVSYMISTVKIGISNIKESQTLSSSCLGSFFRIPIYRFEIKIFLNLLVSLVFSCPLLDSDTCICMYELTIHVINLSGSLLFPFRVALISLPSGLFTRISVTL